MSCCSSTTCPHNYAPWFARIGFSLVLIGFGVNHYRFIDSFTGMASGVFTNTAIAAVAGFLAYIVPALMIVGGTLFAVKKYGCWSKFCILAALGGIMGWAGLGLLFGSAEIGATLGPAIQGAAVLLITYHIVKKMSCCGSGCCTPQK